MTFWKAENREIETRSVPVRARGSEDLWEDEVKGDVWGQQNCDNRYTSFKCICSSFEKKDLTMQKENLNTCMLKEIRLGGKGPRNEMHMHKNNLTT